MTKAKTYEQPKMVRAKCYSVKIDAGHTSGGDPKRGWLVYDTKGVLLGFVDEGYKGRQALKKIFPNVVELVRLAVIGEVYVDALQEQIN